MKQRREEELGGTDSTQGAGCLVGRIAHDLNNLLTVTTGHAELLLETVREADQIEQIREIKKAGERAASLIGQLLAHSRRLRHLPPDRNLARNLPGACSCPGKGP